jgi:hypothetical protein
MLAQGMGHFKREEGMEPDDLLCSRNARSRTPLVGRAQWKINQPPSLEITSELGRIIYMDGGRSTCALGDNPDHLLKTVEGKWRSGAGIASTERTREPEKVLNRQRLCPASRSNIQSLQCLGNRMKFIPFVSE